ncbi:MAG: hypothetical protein R3A52_15130 [Polyangiales bacterium]
MDFSPSACVSFDGSTSAPTFELYMERVTETGTTVFRHAGVAATASPCSASTTPTGWATA